MHSISSTSVPTSVLAADRGQEGAGPGVSAGTGGSAQTTTTSTTTNANGSITTTTTSSTGAIVSASTTGGTLPASGQNDRAHANPGSAGLLDVDA